MSTVGSIMIFLLTVFTGSAIQAVSGFGFGIFVMMVFPYFFPTVTASTISTLLSITSCCLITIRMRRHIQLCRILLPLISYFIVSYMAISLSAVSSPVFLKKLLAVALIALSLYFIFFSSKIKIHPTPAAGLTAGAISGLLGGFFAISGPPMVVYLLSASKDNDTYLASIQAFFLITNIYTTVVRAAQGLIRSEDLGWWAVGATAMLGGLVLGRFLFKKLNATMLRRIVYAVMAVSGVILLV